LVASFPGGCIPPDPPREETTVLAWPPVAAGPNPPEGSVLDRGAAGMCGLPFVEKVKVITGG
jgi:hypothetical protein